MVQVLPPSLLSLFDSSGLDLGAGLLARLQAVTLKAEGDCWNK